MLSVCSIYIFSDDESDYGLTSVVILGGLAIYGFI
jgi:hypothetical protein